MAVKALKTSVLPWSSYKKIEPTRKMRRDDIAARKSYHPATATVLYRVSGGLT
jgi:hypothetical protein